MTGVVNSNDAVNCRAFIETTTLTMNIDGSHHRELSCWDGRTWALWDTHQVNDSTCDPEDDPYWVSEIADYEFTAGGGG